MYYGEMKPIILAHRGGPEGNKKNENSLTTFQGAVQVGFHYLETDVRLDTLGELRLIHRASSILPNQPVKGSVLTNTPTLKQLFLQHPECMYAIDPKHEDAVEPLAKLIVEMKMQKQVCFGASFDARAQKTADDVFKMCGYRPATAMVSMVSTLKLILATSFPFRVRCFGKYPDSPQYIHIHHRLVSKKMIETAHAHNLKLIAWVINDKHEMQQRLSEGIDGFMTDYPSLARELV